MSHRGLAIHIKKYVKAKEELLKLKYFTMQKYNLQKLLLKGTKIPSRYYNSVTNLKFQHKPKYHLLKNPPIKIDLPRGQNPFYIFYNESKHNILALVGEANK